MQVQVQSRAHAADRYVSVLKSVQTGMATVELLSPWRLAVAVAMAVIAEGSGWAGENFIWWWWWGGGHLSPPLNEERGLPWPKACVPHRRPSPTLHATQFDPLQCVPVVHANQSLDSPCYQPTHCISFFALPLTRPLMPHSPFALTLIHETALVTHS